MIEIDGQFHDFVDAAGHDRRRDAYMRELGLEVIRLAAADVYADVDAVAEGLIAMCAEMAGPSTTQLR